jgi:hypothetical protein
MSSIGCPFRFSSSNAASSGWFAMMSSVASVLQTDAPQRATVFSQIAAPSSGFALLVALV